MNNFQVGDRVVCNLRKEPDYPLHKRTAVVMYIMGAYYYISYDHQPSRQYVRSSDHLELNEVYYSPLGEALR